MNAKCILILAPLMAFSLFAESRPAIVGDYIEARSNHVYTCPCLYSGEAVTDGKNAILAWEFRGGSLGDISLAGVKAAAVVVGEDNLGMEANSRRSTLYLDTGKSNVKREALADLLRDRYGNVLGHIVAVHATPIVFQKEGDRVNVRVDDVLEVVVREARLPEDAHSGSQVWYDPFIPVRDPALGTTLYYKYWGGDFGTRWWRSETGITGYMGTFTLART